MIRYVGREGLVHAALPHGPEEWQNRGTDGSVLIAAHTLACDQTRFAGVLDVHGELYDPDAPGVHCKDCRLTVGALARTRIARNAERERLRAEGKPFGMSAMLFQAVWWRTRDGEWCTIDHMGRSHASNAATWLSRHAVGLAFRYTLWNPVPTDCGDISQMALESEEWRRHDDPRGWMESTPLWKALAARGGLS